MCAQEKAAGVLNTPTTTPPNHYTPILGTQEADRKAYATLQAAFALLGVSLRRNHRVDDGRISYEARRNGHTRVFTHLHDLQAYFEATRALVHHPTPKQYITNDNTHLD